jgi:hypothetical protein
VVARTIVHALCQSLSFESTRQRVSHLEPIPDEMWTDEMIADLQGATVANSQISNAVLSKQLSDAVGQIITRLRPAPRSSVLATLAIDLSSGRSVGASDVVVAGQRCCQTPPPTPV